MKIKIRKAEMRDYDRIVSVYKDAINAPNFGNGDLWFGDYPFDYLLVDIKKQELCMLEADNNDIITVFALSKEFDADELIKWKDQSGSSYYIHRFVCNPKYQSQGFGKLSLGIAVDMCKKDGIKFLRLITVSTNTTAIGLYKKVGFVEKPDEKFNLPRTKGTKIIAFEKVV